MSDKRQSQSDRLLELLMGEFHRKLWNPEGWVTLPQIMSLRIASHTRRISDLRKAGHNIVCQKYRTDSGEVHSRYRIIL